MIAQLLTAPPISGTIQERQFDVSARHNAWVRFDTEMGHAWVGVFGAGEPSQFDAVAQFSDDDGQTVLVVAGGQGYVLNARSGELFRRTPWHSSQTVIVPPLKDFVLVAGDCHAWAAGRNTDLPIWRRDRARYDADTGLPPRRLALDGIRFETASSSEVIGRVWELDGWYAFAIDLSTLEFTRGTFLSPDWSFTPRGACGLTNAATDSRSAELRGLRPRSCLPQLQLSYGVRQLQKSR